MANRAIVRKGRLIARPNFADLPRKSRGGPGKPTGKSKMKKAALKGGKGSDITDLETLKKKMEKEIPSGFKDPTADRYS